jgi:hypothetical protein
MSLPQKFDKRIKSALALHAVWPPGDPVEIGDVFTKSGGVFRPIDNLSSFGVVPHLQEFPDQRTLNFEATGTRRTTFQHGNEVDADRLDANATARVEIEFTRKDSYFIRTTELTGVEIENVRSAVRSLRDHSDWRHGRYFIAWQLYTASAFSFLGTETRNRKVVFSGKGETIRKFLTLGITAGLTRTSTGSMTIDLTGKKGPIAMALVRVRKNGEIVFA